MRHQREFNIRFLGRIRTEWEALEQKDAASYSFFIYGSLFNLVLFFQYLTTFYGLPIFLGIGMTVLSLRLLKHNSVLLSLVLLVLFGCHVVILKLDSALINMKGDSFLLAILIIFYTLWFGIRGVQATFLLAHFEQKKVHNILKNGSWLIIYIVATIIIAVLSENLLPKTVQWNLQWAIGFGLSFVIVMILLKQIEQTKQSTSFS